MSQMTIWIVIVAVAVVVLMTGVYLFKAFNSPDGERYLRQRNQGPFVPRDGDGE